MKTVPFGKYKRYVDNRSKWQGDTDVEKGVIRINKKKSKKKSSVIDTIVHEEMHAKHPKMHEKTVKRKTWEALKLKKMGKKAKRKLYSRYNKPSRKVR
jgi:acetyl-CoA carboxylase alpha subunit